MSGESNLRIKDLEVNYRLSEATIKALDGVTLEIPLEKGGIGIVGESGSGKTTLGMSIMNSIEYPGTISKGSIMFNGSNVLQYSKSELKKYRWEQVAMVYQSAMNSLNPVKSVQDPIIEVLREHRREMSNGEARERALDLLSQVGIKQERVKDYPHEFSGGMRQRVVIALALALSPKLLIADEPTSALDVVTQRQILSLLRRNVEGSGLSLLFITHEISVLGGLVDEIVVMFAGEIVEKGPIDQVFGEPLHPYTEALLANLLTIDSETEIPSVTTSQGELPKTRNLRMALKSKKASAEGAVENYCKYSGRCKYAFDRCNIERPILTEIQRGRWVACHKYA